MVCGRWIMKAACCNVWAGCRRSGAFGDPIPASSWRIFPCRSQRPRRHRGTGLVALSAQACAARRCSLRMRRSALCGGEPLQACYWRLVLAALGCVNVWCVPRCLRHSLVRTPRRVTMVGIERRRTRQNCRYVRYRSIIFSRCGFNVFLRASAVFARLDSCVLPVRWRKNNLDHIQGFPWMVIGTLKFWCAVEPRGGL